MTEKIGFPNYILEPAELDKDYEGVSNSYFLTL